MIQKLKRNIMQNTPLYLSDRLMPVYKFALIFSFMLGFASIFAGVGYALYTYSATELSFASSMYCGLILFLKGAGITASISFVSFLAFWKKHQIAFNNCQKSQDKNCFKPGFLNFA